MEEILPQLGLSAKENDYCSFTEPPDLHLTEISDELLGATMAVDLSPIDADLLKTLTDVHGIPAGAYNIRKDGELLSRSNSANIEIATKTDNPGIDIFIEEGTKG